MCEGLEWPAKPNHSWGWPKRSTIECRWQCKELVFSFHIFKLFTRFVVLHEEVMELHEGQQLVLSQSRSVQTVDVAIDVDSETMIWVNFVLEDEKLTAVQSKENNWVHTQEKRDSEPGGWCYFTWFYWMTSSNSERKRRYDNNLLWPINPNIMS